METSTKQFYKQRLEEVLEEIENYLSKSVDVKRLSQIKA